MSWRTVVISERAKLDLKMGYLVVRKEEVTKKIILDEISVLIIENTAVSITCCLLAELVNRKVKVIFCDDKRNPSSELFACYGSHDCSEKIRKQIGWEDDIKVQVWTRIVFEKIYMQKELLILQGKEEEAALLDKYLEEICKNDITNREGHAAKVYFNALFGKEFKRTSDNAINAALNYGYSIILSVFNRECVESGYLTQLGLFHHNVFNHFNLTCDLMEPFRVLVDAEVVKQGYCVFGTNEKHQLIDVLNHQVEINDSVQYVSNAIRIYSKSVFDAIEKRDVSSVKFYRMLRGGRSEL